MFKSMIFSSADSNLPFKSSTDLFFGGTDASWGKESFVPQPGIESMPPAVEVQSLNCWIARKF